jgi:hydroxyethylthiazole kinase-like uncharacterized protein yjeF
VPLPIISIAEMREWEKETWATGQTEAEVIRRVGRVVAEHAISLTRTSDLILILAGKGHNGDDAKAAVEHLKERRVEILDVQDAKIALESFTNKIVATESRPSLVIDGLFGIGLGRTLDEDWTKLVNAVNQSHITILAIDIPSGLNADSGEPQGAAVKAVVTLTVGAPKLGMFKPSALPFMGRLEVASDVGLIKYPGEGEMNWTLPQDFAGFPPNRQPEGHKGTYGHLAVVAGSMGYHGAAVMAARSAQRAQPGLITLFTQENVYHPIAAQLQAVMVNTESFTLSLSDNFNAALIGPGLAASTLTDDMKAMTRRLWRDMPCPMIVDASALDWLAQGHTQKDAIRILTPHPGEAARLLKSTTQEVQADRLKALREISKRYGDCWVVLKGHHTLIGRSTGEVYVNSSGNPFLAQGGSGDVLAGYIAGLFAQPHLQSDVCKTLHFAVWQHGAAADALQQRNANWTVEDLISEIGNVPAK